MRTIEFAAVLQPEGGRRPVLRWECTRHEKPRHGRPRPIEERYTVSRALARHLARDHGILHATIPEQASLVE